MYSWKSRRHGADRIGELALLWFVYNDALSDDYDSSEVDARDLWRIWRDKNPIDEQAESRWGEGAVRISWLVSGDASFEGAPFAVDISGYESETFLDHYTNPIEVATGDPIQWTRLPVEDKVWREDRSDKGGFIQEATGWKPSPLQPVFWPDQVAAACGLFIPER